MTTQIPEGIHVRAHHGHVEVTGLNKQDVEYAIQLSRAVIQERIQARTALASQAKQAILEENLDLVSHASQRQIIRSATLRKQLVHEQGAETYSTLALLRDSQESSVRTWVSRSRNRHELFTVDLQGITLIPRVQLTETGSINPLIAELVRPLKSAGLDGWSLWAWLTSPTGLLSGDTPANVASTNIGRAARAATRYATDLRQAQEIAT